MLDIPQVENRNPQSLSSGKLENPSLGDEKVHDLKLRQAAKDFESIFISQLIKAMEKTIPKSNLKGSSNTLPSMLFSTTLGKAVANQGGVGLSDMIYRALKARDHDSRQVDITPESFFNPVDVIDGMNGIVLDSDD